MAVAYVRVTSALTGEELLPETPVLCVDLMRHIREALVRPRPSTGATLLHAGALIPEGFQVAPDDHVELTAVFGGDALTMEERMGLMARLQGPPPYSLNFRHFSKAAQDDKAVVLVAVRQHSSGLLYASEQCKSDKEIVLAAVQSWGSSLCHASEACKNDREIVLAAVRNNGVALRYAGEACRDDKEIVLAAVNQADPWQNLEHAGKMCKDDKELVLAAVRMNGASLCHASEACKNNKEIVLAAVRQDRMATQYAGAACKNDREIRRATQGCSFSRIRGCADFLGGRRASCRQ